MPHPCPRASPMPSEDMKVATDLMVRAAVSSSTLTFDSLLSAHTAPQTADEAQQTAGEGCRVQTLLHRLPRLLLLQLQMFRQTTDGKGAVEKACLPVQLDDVLNIRKSWLSEKLRRDLTSAPHGVAAPRTPNTEGTAANTATATATSATDHALSYELVAVVFHVGTSMHAGHYRCAVLASDDRGVATWCLCDDDVITVYRDLRSLKSDDETETPYLLLFRRMDAKDTLHRNACQMTEEITSSIVSSQDTVLCKCPSSENPNQEPQRFENQMDEVEEKINWISLHRNSPIRSEGMFESDDCPPRARIITMRMGNEYTACTEMFNADFGFYMPMPCDHDGSTSGTSGQMYETDESLCGSDETAYSDEGTVDEGESFLYEGDSITEVDEEIVLENGSIMRWTYLQPEADESAAVVAEADESAAVVAEADESAAVVAEADESAAVVAEADESAAVVAEADESAAVVAEADESAAVVAEADESAAVVAEADESAAVVAEADESAAVVAEADESAAVVAEADESAAVVAEADESAAVVAEADESAAVVAEADESAAVVAEADESAAVVAEADESAAVVANADESVAAVVANEWPGAPRSSVKIRRSFGTITPCFGWGFGVVHISPCGSDAESETESEEWTDDGDWTTDDGGDDL
ncbi:uncharacterized protein LOC108674149 [Hyalella azteca]|uniref:Ubiquitin carboxyl-terminal hydrolase 36 n=1 Tax=Hyalella azteca TaxID=294128 RepID=A0A979FRF6_HYAAZ|nr:uncharacterized protein LOC108674149 [Hyalella azteca]